MRSLISRFQGRAVRGRTTRLVAGVLVVPVLFCLYLIYAWSCGLDAGDRIYTVKRGSSLKSFAGELYRDGVTPDRFSLIWLAYLRGQHRGLKLGEYRFEKGISQRELLDQVVAGKSIQYSLLIPEGWNFREMMQAVAGADRLEHTLKDLTPEQIMMRLGYRGQHHEGRFYPDTYLYSAGTQDTVILQQAYRKMEQRLAAEWGQREEGLPYRNPYEALILASIVEKETGVASERAEIAGVFINRLAKGMRLQTDPTVIYGMGERFDGNLRKRDLQRNTPYNTYRRGGLPPTPIAMPGGDAIHAALHPAKTGNLYFVSRGDGAHHFSATFREHQNAVIRYQLSGKR